MKSSFSKHIITRSLSGKLLPGEEQELLNRKSVVSRMKQEWDLPGDDRQGFDRQKGWRRIKSEIQHESVPRRYMVTSRIWPVAASVLILLSIGYYWFSHGNKQDERVQTLAYETRNEERLFLTLPDSTKVWLNAGSRIEYPEKFSRDTRMVKLNGEAYFDVTHKMKQPFLVVTEKLQVHVLGTKFTVSDYQKESSAEAVLVSGKVNVTVVDDSLSRHFGLLPNEQLLFDKQQHVTTIQTVNAPEYAEWINGKLTFDNVELGYVIDRLERWYGRTIECSCDLRVSYRLTFTVRNESLEQIIQIMQSTIPVRFQQSCENYKAIEFNEAN